MLFNCGVGEDSWESLGLQEDPISQSQRKSVLNIHWKDWCWSWNSNTLATWCKELSHWKRPCCWERLKVGREGDDRGWDGWIASPTRWTWVWVSSESWWWTGKTGVLQCMGMQRVRHNWATELKHKLHYFLYEHSNLNNCRETKKVLLSLQTPFHPHFGRAVAAPFLKSQYSLMRPGQCCWVVSAGQCCWVLSPSQGNGPSNRSGTFQD